MSKKKDLDELITGNKENAEELSAADIKVASGKDKIEKNISKLILENKQNAEELSGAYKIIATQKKEIKKQAAALIGANKERAKHEADLVLVKKELAHKAKLFILNKELMLANKQEKLIKEEYFELYNFAPSGYLTLTREGKIVELNLLASKILGNKLSFLKDRWFGNYVSDDTKPAFNSFIEQIFKSHTQQLCDVTLSTGSDLPIYVYLSGIVTKDTRQCLITIDDITERKKAEEKLEKSEMLLKSVFDSSGNLINVIDRDLRVVMSNWKSPVYAGCTEFQTGSHCFEAFINRDAPCEPCPVFSVFNTGKPILSEYYNQYTKLFKEINAYPIFDDDNNVTMVVENVRDITEHKLAEKALKESEEKFRSIMENSADAIFIINQEGKYVYTNKEVSAMLGYTTEEMINKTIADISPKDKIEEYYNIFKKILDEGKGFAEIELIKKDGKCISSDLNAVLLPDGFVYASCRDITERKQVERSLELSEKKYRDLTELLPLSIFETDSEGNLTYANKKGFDSFGYNNSDFEKGINIFQAIVPEDIEHANKNFRNSLMTGSQNSSEYLVLRKDGSSFPSLVQTIPIIENGKTVGVRGFIIDLTKSKQTESELISAKEKAEESDRLKSAFLTNMSHEIRTPMNGILGFAELLREPNISSDDQRDFIQTMQISGARMLNTINSIVDISKIESGLTKVDIKETNINEKIEFTYKFFKPETENKGLQFIFKNGLPSKESFIKTDNEKVYSILTNLVKNAIKFTYDGSIEFGYEKKGEYLEFFVKDTGIGIPENKKELIFERFRHGSESFNRGYEGSGLGLSISKSYVEMLGGKIWVDSVEGRGSTFYFTIPYIEELTEKTESINVVSGEKEVELRRLKTLIVEDDEISYSLLTRTLQKISKEVLHAVTGVEAIEACRNNPDLDLVLMDIRMPRMNGLEATQQIRLFNKNVIIIAQTAYAFAGDCEKAIEAGCNDYISKPVNKTLLYELIKKHCNK